MKKDELWKIYVRNNPHWLTENITLTPEGLRKLFDQTYDKAHKQGVENGKAISARDGKPPTSRNKASDVIGDILGR